MLPNNEDITSSVSNTCHVIPILNGFDALTLIYKAYIQLGKMKKGDEVIVPANTYIATILAIIQADLVPVLVEPQLETYTINPNLIAEKITNKTEIEMTDVNAPSALFLKI